MDARSIIGLNAAPRRLASKSARAPAGSARHDLRVDLTRAGEGRSPAFLDEVARVGQRSGRAPAAAGSVSAPAGDGVEQARPVFEEERAGRAG